MSQIPRRFQTHIDRQVALYGQGTTSEIRNSIPLAGDIPLLNRRHWFNIPDVISVFVDMVGSTRLSAQKHARSTARDLFNEFDAPYIDVRGDGAFGLFNQDQIYLAFAAAVTFKTFVEVEFVPRFEQDTGIELAHIGIDQGTVLVRRIGPKRRDDRTDRQKKYGLATQSICPRSLLV